MSARTPPTENLERTVPTRSTSSLSVLAGKAATVPPKVSRPDNVVELKSMGPSINGAGESLPVEEDIMQLARLGEVTAVQRLFESKKFSVNYEDEEGITPLHWAAINNQYAMCKFLLDSGANVNAKGGESVATPAMWAAQRCNYYIVNLLLHHGADPLLSDVQGYNILHLATIDGNAFLLVLLLHQGIPVDVADPQGHTGLMWAAYKGFPACVDLFLRWGANVNSMDDGGLTPLHWALVKGSHPCVQKIIEYGADRFAKTRDSKMPVTVAREMNTTRVWYRALNDCGYDAEGNTRVLPLGLTTLLRNKNIISKFFLFWPFAIVFIAVWILSHMVIFAAVPITLVTIFALQWVAQQVANNGPPETRVLLRTPFLAGIFAGSLFWVGVRYITKILLTTFSFHPFLNLFFMIFYSMTTYFYVYSMAEDPGFIPKLGSRNKQNAVIGGLLDSWQFDEEHFCIYCMIRKPLRSKHCKRCGRCVAKHDHHCPWIDNCVGTNNFRHFVMYIICLEIGITLFIQLVVKYIYILPPQTDAKCNILNTTLCDAVHRDTFTIVLTIWISLQLIWITMLCAVQLVHISRNQTTYENMKGHSIHHTHSSAQAIPFGVAADSGRDPSPGFVPSGHPPHQQGCFQQWKGLLGLDTFLATAQAGFSEYRGSSRQKNLFSRGTITNCRDFWCDPAPVFGKRDPGSGMLDGEVVNYYRMYEAPLQMQDGGYRSLAGEDPEQVV